MQTKFEEIIEAARHLSPEEIEKLGEWARQQRAATPKTSEKKSTQIQEEIRKYKAACEWIEAHRQEYLGQWVCLDGDVLISADENGSKVYEEAIAKGIESPFMEFVKEEEVYYLGGWEKCR